MLVSSVTDGLCHLGGRFFARDITTRRLWLLEAGLLAIALSFGLFGLDRSPTVWYDETFYNEPAYQLAVHGKLISGLEPGVASREKAFLYPPLYTFFQSVIFRVFGFGIWQVRLTCLFFYLLSGLIMFLAAKTYFRYEISGLASSALFLLDPSVVKSWRSGRPDAMAVLLGVTAFYILIRVLRMGTIPHRGRRETQDVRRKTGRLLYPASYIIRLMSYVFVAGTIAGLACITHPNSLSFAISGLIFLLFGLNTWKERVVAVVMYGTGGVLGIAPYVTLILRHSDIFAQQYLTLSAMNTSVSDFLTGVVAQIEQLTRYYKLFPFLPCVYIAGLIWGLRSAEFRIFSLASCWALVLYFGVIHNSHPLPYVVPIVALGAGGLTTFYISQLSETQAKLRRILVLLAFLIMVNGLGVLALRAFATIWQWEGRSHNALVNEWREKIRSGVIVAAPPGCFYAALGNGNIYRYNRIVLSIGAADTYEYRWRLVEDNIEYLVLPANADPHDYLLDEHINLLRYVDSIRRPMRHLIGIEVGEYNFDIYRRK